MTCTRPLRFGPSVPLVIVAALLFTGCASDLVTKAVHNGRLNFNDAIVQSWNEQLLLNLVRLRYRDNPLFLEMGTVITGYTLKGASALGGGTSLTSPLTGAWTLSLGGEYTTSPTLTYYPLRWAGEETAGEYIASRIAYYEARTDEHQVRAAGQRSDARAGKIWQRAAEAARISGESLRSSQMLPAINAVIDPRRTRHGSRVRCFFGGGSKAV